MAGFARDRAISRVACDRGFGGEGKRANKFFERCVKIVWIWCNIKKRQISGAMAA
ncbi:MAG: hypothetical protein HC849_04990 [Oscillatoriales cyanobacterium RU_3_3]|nr:hypothetical protein [Microcoleus sp. SU_5_6]NJL65874.1 hypothetical protein [Microcoleus sp. SM1_3_4]NJM59685.1 hypothetical protein [Oscillatoriales cyanobacterium RU_3_3]